MPLKMDPASLNDYLSSQTVHTELFDRFHEKDLLSKLKYSEQVQLMELYESALLIDQHADFSIRSNELNKSTTVAANASFFSTKLFWSHFSYLDNLLARFNFGEATAFVLKETNIKRLRNLLETRKDIELSPPLALMMALGASRFELNRTTDDELKLIETLTQSLAPANDWRLVKQFLDKRSSSVRRLRVNRPSENVVKKKALMICGQLRGYEQALPELWKLIPDKENTHVYVSTWKNPGAASVDKHRLERRFSAEAVELLRSTEHRVEFDRLKGYIDSKFPLPEEQHIIQNIQNILVGAGQVSIHVADDSTYPYNHMNNHDKMYYHNAYWIETLGKEFFISKFTQMLKVRPDYRLSPTIDSNAIFDTPDLAADVDGWILDVWGFGMGDQMFGGPTDIMTEIMSISFPKNLSTLLMLRIMNKNQPVMGHINLGLESWALGQTVTRIPHRRYNFAEVTKIDSGTVKEFLQRTIN